MEGVAAFFQNMVNSFSDAVFQSLIKEDRYQYLLRGLGISLLLTLIAAVIGVVVGLLLAIAKLQDVNNLTGNRFTRGLRRWLTGFANGYISVVRGTPAVVQLMIIYFIVFGRLLKGIFPFSLMEDYQIAGVAFGLNSAAYVAEIIRAGIMAVDQGTNRSRPFLGLSGRASMFSIVIPQAVKNVLPALGNEFIVLLKETSVAGYIGIADLTKGAQSVGSITYDYIVPLICAAFIYFLMTTVLSTGIGALERRLHKSD